MDVTLHTCGVVGMSRESLTVTKPVCRPASLPKMVPFGPTDCGDPGFGGLPTGAGAPSTFQEKTVATPQPPATLAETEMPAVPAGHDPVCLTTNLCPAAIAAMEEAPLYGSMKPFPS